MDLALRDQERHTYGDYLTWTDDARYELIDGAAYAIAPAPAVVHQDLVLAIARQVADALEDSPFHVLAARVDVLLPKAEESDEAVDTVVQPDLLVVCDPSKVGQKRVRGAPDWVVEVLSPATAAHDHLRKRQIYEQYGVREYWLVHPVDRVLLVYRLEKGAYGKPIAAELKQETRVSVLPAVVIDWARTTRRMPETNQA